MQNSKTPILYVPVLRKNSDSDSLNYSSLSKLPKTLLIAYTIQYKPSAEKISFFLKKKNHNILSFKQVLGCSKLSEPEKKCPILLISDGNFHALNLAMQTNSPIYIYTAGKILLFNKEQIKKLKAQRTAKLSKFLMSDRIGIIISTKSGQYNLEKAESLKKVLEKMKKAVYLFMTDNVNLQELENFSVESWINTACPGLAFDSNKILNIEDLSSINIRI